MNVYNNLANLPQFKNAVLTIGSFDGVHSGHQKIIERLKELAKAIDGESILITFHPHPRHVIYPNDDSLKLLSTIEEKVQLLEKYGIDNVVIVPFNKEFSSQSPETYIQSFLIDKFNPACIVIGYDHKFGKDRKGDIAYLRKFSTQQGFEIVEIAKQEVEDIAVSSTKVRTAVENGEMQTAKLLLNHFYSLSGTVVRGAGIGKELGYPTANIHVGDRHKLIPPEGIYAVYTYHQQKRYDGMLYIGDRPTVDKKTNITIEVNIFDFDQDIYEEIITVEFVDFIRHDVKFDSLEGLKDQLRKDKISTETILQAYSTVATTSVSEVVKKLPSVSVVILNYNGLEYLQKFLPTLLKTSYENLEIIIADNGSTDTSLDFLKKQYPDLQVIRMGKNYGFAGGYNQCLKHIEADYYVLLNSDVEVSPNWIQPVIEQMERDASIGACQPKIISYQDKSVFEYAGGAGGWIDAMGIPFCKGRIFDVLEKDQGQYDQIEEIFWASGAAFFIRAQLFHDLDGFDADFFAHVEEIDLCWRIKRAGYKVMTVPSSTVYHFGGGTLNYNNPKKTYLNFRNSLFMLLKNEPFQKLLWVIPTRLIVDGMAGVLFLFSGKFRHIQSIVQAHWSFFRHFQHTLKKRKFYDELIQKTRIAPQENRTGILAGSIIWKYYALRKKYFTQL